MNGKEILTVVEVVSNEKGVDKEVIFGAVEAALATATKKRFDGDVDVRVAIDRNSGEYQAFRRWEVVPDDAEEFEPDRQIRLSEARERQPDIEVGDYIEEPIEAVEFGRIGAQTAKQVIVQKVREAERAKMVELFRDRKGGRAVPRPQGRDRHRPGQAHRQGQRHRRSQQQCRRHHLP